jgi:hypothetical protein
LVPWCTRLSHRQLAVRGLKEEAKPEVNQCSICHGAIFCVDKNQSEAGRHANQEPSSKPIAVYLCLHWMAREQSKIIN